MRASPRIRYAIVNVALALTLGACGGDDDGGGFSPTMDNVAGTYHATTFTSETPGGSINLLQLGASVNVTLNANGTTSGQLLVPTAGENGSTLDEDLAGTWELSGSTVTFSQTTSTLIEGAEFTAEQNTLTGSGTFNGSTLLLVLTKNG